MLTDTYGSYTPSPPLPPVPPFPCQENSSCTASNRLCSAHKYVLFVTVLEKDGKKVEYEIPYGHWENWDWYSDRIAEVSGIGKDSMRIIFAGCQRFPGELKRHSGLQYQSHIHVVTRSQTTAVDPTASSTTTKEER